MALLWTYSDQQQIKPISSNFPREQFEQLQNEVQAVDLQKLLGFDFYQDIIQNPTSTANAALLDGGTYVVSGVTYSYVGLKYTLAYYLYARYVKVSSHKDTYGGIVKKNFEESRELNEGANANYRKDFRIIAGKYWEENEQFLIANYSDYPYYYSNPLPRSCWASDSYNRGFCI